MEEYSKEEFSYHQIKIITELNKSGLNEMITGDIRSMVDRAIEFQLPRFLAERDNNKTKEYKRNVEKENFIRNKFLN
jgi:hypothetical protein